MTACNFYLCPVKVVKSIASFLCILVLLTSVVGVSISRHYCLGMLRHEHFFSTSESCAAEKVIDCHHENDTDNAFVPNCCEDEYVAIPGLEVESQLKKQRSDFVTAAYVAKQYFAHRDPILSVTLQSWGYAPNPPPILGKQILVQHQCFLI